jgi:oleate hydratase
LFKDIPSLTDPLHSVYQETVDFNALHPPHSMARLVDRRRAIVPVRSMGFDMKDRLELLKLTDTDEKTLGASRITDWLSPAFFDTEFWFMWATTFAFQPWHSAVEFKRYLHRFMLEFTRIETLGGVRRTVYNQYDSLVRPLQRWLTNRGVRMMKGCVVTEIDHAIRDGRFMVTSLRYREHDQPRSTLVEEDDLVILQNGSMTDASSLGSMTKAPASLTRVDSGGWDLWERLAKEPFDFGNPAAFNRCIAQSCWESFTVTLKAPAFFDAMEQLSGNEAGTGGLVTFKDSNWLMSIVLAHQPHFADQPRDVQVFWGYALLPDRIGNFIAKPMAECSGAEILHELCGHLRFDLQMMGPVNCIPCRMPYITSMFMPREKSDRPLPIPRDTKNFAFVSQFVELETDVVFTVEYSVRAAQIAVYGLLGIDREIPAITPHDQSRRTQFDAVVKAFA